MEAWGVSRRFAGVALGGALLADLLELALGAVDADAGHPAVDLDLLFTHAACGGATARATAAFAVEVTPHAGHAGQGILHAGELDLQPGFARLGALGKDVEDDLLTVDHTEVGGALPLALLGRGKLVVEDDAVALVGLCELDDLGGLAGAAEELLVHRARLREDLLNDADSQGRHQLLKLLEQGFRLVGFAWIKIEPHQEGALDHLRFLADFEHSWEGIAGAVKGCQGVGLVFEVASLLLGPAQRRRRRARKHNPERARSPMDGSGTLVDPRVPVPVV